MKAGLVGRYMPKQAESFPAETKEKDGHWAAIYTLYLTTGYNSDLVKDEDAPKTYEDLLDPKWKGKMAWSDIRSVSGPGAFIGNILQVMGEEKGMDYLKKLAQQKITGIPSNQRVVLDQVIAGQYSIGLMIYNHHTVISREQGAPVKSVKMQPLLGHLGIVALAANAPRPNAAKLFLEYISSEEGQKIVSNAYYPPSRPDVPPRDPSTSPATAHFKATVMTPEMTEAPLARWLKIYDELFK
jgi:iron(III) transport system substrate-binding protein